MIYFQDWIQDTDTNEEIEIAIQCDLVVFEWLMQFMADDATPPRLTNVLVIPILLSASFLMMPLLVELCLSHVTTHLNTLLASDVDMSHLIESHIEWIAAHTHEESLLKIEDSHDVIVSRIYRKKCEQLSQQSNLFRCVYCQCLFTQESRSEATCPCAPILVDFHGRIITSHMAAKYWSLHSYIMILFQEHWSAHDVYWHVWTHIHTLQCIKCHQKFPLAQWKDCAYHPKPPLFKNEHDGKFPCCKATFSKSSGPETVLGCKRRTHEVKQTPHWKILESLPNLKTIEKRANQFVLREAELMAMGDVSEDDNDPWIGEFMSNDEVELEKEGRKKKKKKKVQSPSKLEFKRKKKQRQWVLDAALASDARRMDHLVSKLAYTRLPKQKQIALPIPAMNLKPPRLSRNKKASA